MQSECVGAPTGAGLLVFTEHVYIEMILSTEIGNISLIISRRVAQYCVVVAFNLLHTSPCVNF